MFVVNDEKTKVTQISRERCRRLLIISTSFYLLFFPFLTLYTFLYLVMLGANNFGLIFLWSILILSAIPISFAISVFLMWFRYSQNQSDKACFITKIPVLVTLGVICLDFLHLMFFS